MWSNQKSAQVKTQQVSFRTSWKQILLASPIGSRTLVVAPARSRHPNTIPVPNIECGAAGAHGRIPSLKLCECEGVVVFADDAIARVAGNRFIPCVACLGVSQWWTGSGWEGWSEERLQLFVMPVCVGEWAAEVEVEVFDEDVAVVLVPIRGES